MLRLLQPAVQLGASRNICASFTGSSAHTSASVRLFSIWEILHHLNKLFVMKTNNSQSRGVGRDTSDSQMTISHLPS